SHTTYMRVYFYSCLIFLFFVSFFFNDTATTEIYTLSLHDALPISVRALARHARAPRNRRRRPRIALEGANELLDRRGDLGRHAGDRKSTRLNSSHVAISYAVFCLKKKKTTRPTNTNKFANLKHTPR